MAAQRTRKTKQPIASNAIDIAFEAVANDKTLDSPARALLVNQNRLVGWQIASERAAFGLRLLTGLAGLAVAGALAVEVWQASRADGLVIEAFSTPPQLVERGVTGEAVARQLMDRINALAAAANSSEPQRRVAGDLAQNISIQIPRTGVSLAQLDQWLKGLIGRERRVSGEVMFTAGGDLVVAARNGQIPLPTLTGPSDDLPPLLQQSAETIFAREQPDSYMGYLINTRRLDDALRFGQARAAAGSADEKARAYDQVAGVLSRLGRSAEAYELSRKAINLKARPSWRAMGSISPSVMNRGHPEEAAQLLTNYLNAIRKVDERDRLTPRARQIRILLRGAMLAHLRGEFSEELRAADELERLGPTGSGMGNLGSSQDVLIRRTFALTGLHEVKRAQSLVLGLADQDRSVVANAGFVPKVRFEVMAAAQDWTGALAAIDADLAALPVGFDPNENWTMAARRAAAQRQLGRLAEAQAQLAATPLDCQECIVERGLLAAAQGDARTADHWLGEAVKMAPSIPFANLEWGKVLLARGELSRAFETFAAASKRSPNFADPKTGLGEVLLAQGKPAAAIKLFRQADKLAPNWGRNHLLWAEALAKRGKNTQAKAQRALAASLHLTPIERARLAQLGSR